MKTTIVHFYTADKGKVFFRKSTGKVVGRRVRLESDSDISDYEEIDFTDERAKDYRPYDFGVLRHKRK